VRRQKTGSLDGARQGGRDRDRALSAFLIKTLLVNVLTGDGYLMAGEVGA